MLETSSALQIEVCLTDCLSAAIENIKCNVETEVQIGSRYIEMEEIFTYTAGSFVINIVQSKFFKLKEGTGQQSFYRYKMNALNE